MKRSCVAALAMSICHHCAYADPLTDFVKGAAKTVTGGVGKMTDGVTSVLTSIVSPADSAFHSAVQEQRWQDALAGYEKNGDALRQNNELAGDVQALLHYARAGREEELRSKAKELQSRRDSRSYMKSLSDYVNTLASANELDRVYLAQWRVLRDFEQSDDNLAELRAQRELAISTLRTNLAEAYAAYPHERSKFADELWEPVDEPKLFAASLDTMVKRIGQESDDDARALVKATSAAWSTNPLLKQAVAKAVWGRLDATNSSPLAMLSMSKRLEEFGLASADAPVHPKVLVYDASQNRDASFKFNSVVDETVTAAADVERETGPLIVFYITDASASRNIVDKKDVPSSYVSGSRQVPNPSYSIAQMDCQRAQSNYAAQQARNSLLPARGWGAVIQGVAEGLSAASVQQVCNQFAAMQAYTDEDVYSKYSYTQTEVSISKKVAGRIFAVDPSGGTVEAYPLALDEKKTVSVVYGRKPEDHSPLNGQIADADLEHLAAAPLEIDGSALIASLSTTMPERYTLGGFTNLLAHPPQGAPKTDYASNAPAAAVIGTGGGAKMSPVALASNQNAIDAATSDPRMSSVVVILNPSGLMGAGFYVDPNEILTNYHVVEGSSTLQVRSVEGKVFTGKVVKRDIGLDLAVVKVDVVGQPVQFANTVVKIGQSVEAIGHPQGLFFSVSRGIVSAVRQMKGVLAPGADKALLIQTDAAINAGNSGGPLFMQDRVVGVNTIKFKGAQGLGFAVHYSEVLRFLSQ